MLQDRIEPKCFQLRFLGRGKKTTSAMALMALASLASLHINDIRLHKIKLFFLVSLGGNSFGTISSLQRHRQCVHEGQTKTCPICLKVMSKNCKLQQHIDTVHKGLTKHVCDICGKKFGWVQHLSRHKKQTHNIHPVKNSTLVQAMQEYKNIKPLDLVHKN